MPWLHGNLAEGLAAFGPMRPGAILTDEGWNCQASASFPAITPWGSWPAAVDTSPPAAAQDARPERKLPKPARALPKAAFPTTATPRSTLPGRFAPMRREPPAAVATIRSDKPARARLAGAGALLALLLVALPALWLIWSLPPLDVAAAAKREEAARAPRAEPRAPGAQVARQDLPNDLLHAVIAIEDRRFYDHFGVDPAGVARAAIRNYRAGKIMQGGSTITQQLAKVVYLTPEQTMRRKLQEAVIAVWLDMRLSKDEIITAYLNNIYFGAGATGVAQAAEVISKSRCGISTSPSLSCLPG
jgi:penicillin-binding protein 1A